MGKPKSLRRFIRWTCGFEFDFRFIHEGWTVDHMMSAIDTGHLLRNACVFLELDIEQTEQAIKRYALRQCIVERSRLTVREQQLMAMYYDHTILGHTLGELLEKVSFCEPEAWLQCFENPLILLQSSDQSIWNRLPPFASSLTLNNKRTIIHDLFGSFALEFHPGLASEHVDSQWNEAAWNPYSHRYGASMRMFKGSIHSKRWTQPHPNDIAENDRRNRLQQQALLFNSLLRTIPSSEPLDVEVELDAFEAELNTAYIEYAVTRFIQAGLHTEPYTTTEGKGKQKALISLAALFTMVNSADIRQLLLHNLIPEAHSGRLPFNDVNYQMENEPLYEENDEVAAFERGILDLEYAKDGRPALYLIVIFIAEFALRSFLRTSLQDATVLFYTAAVLDENNKYEEPLDANEALELKKLKQKLIPIAMWQNDLKTQPMYATEMYDHLRHLKETDSDSESLFYKMYKAVYTCKHRYTKSSQFRMAKKQLLLRGRHRNGFDATKLITFTDEFDYAFKQLMRLKPEDMNVVDIEKMIEDDF
ncbi:hypothetical protein [Paenibacillus wenxiniae]|uniref:Uncharacterized protein n=1 Tax=Paenibacillus wenxiniae TaxID=1636843 RepID=A0ABW4RH47_9BACL